MVLKFSIYKNIQSVSAHYLENDVISSVRKYSCALGLGLRLWLELGLAEIVFGQTCFRASIEDTIQSHFSFFHIQKHPNSIL